MDRKEYLFRIMMVAVVVGLIYVLVVARQLVLISLIGVGIAVILNPPVVWLRDKLKLPRTVGAFLIFSSILGLTCFILFFLGKISTEQLASLKGDIPTYSEKLESLLEVRIGPFGELSSMLQGVDFNSVLSDLVSRMSTILGSTLVGISSATISFVIAFFLCVSSKYYRKQVPLLIRPEKRNEVEKVMKRLGGTLRAYSSALVIDMVCISMITTLGLLLVDFKYWLIMGIVTGFFCLIPYVGVICVALITCLLALAQDASQIPYILLVYVVTQQLEGNLIFPYIMRKRVALPEAPLLIFILIMGQLFGVLGAFIAAPLMAVIIELLNWQREEEDKVFKFANNKI